KFRQEIVGYGEGSFFFILYAECVNRVELEGYAFLPGLFDLVIHLLHYLSRPLRRINVGPPLIPDTQRLGLPVDVGIRGMGDFLLTESTLVADSHQQSIVLIGRIEQGSN